MKIYIPLIVTIFLFKLNVSAQTMQTDFSPKYYLKDFKNLDSLSNVYFQNGDVEFLIIDAYMDGLAKSAKDADFEYQNDSLLLRGHIIPEPYNSKYLAKLHQVYARMYPAKTTWRFALSGGVAPGEKVFVYQVRNEYAIRRQRELEIKENQAYISDRYNKNASALIKTLYDNKIIDDQTEYALIELRWDNIYVNKKKLSDTGLINICTHFLSNIISGYNSIYFNKDDLNKYCALNK